MTKRFRTLLHEFTRLVAESIEEDAALPSWDEFKGKIPKKFGDTRFSILYLLFHPHERLSRKALQAHALETLGRASSNFLNVYYNNRVAVDTPGAVAGFGQSVTLDGRPDAYLLLSSRQNGTFSLTPKGEAEAQRLAKEIMEADPNKVVVPKLPRATEVHPSGATMRWYVLVKDKQNIRLHGKLPVATHTMAWKDGRYVEEAMAVSPVVAILPKGALFGIKGARGSGERTHASELVTGGKRFFTNAVAISYVKHSVPLALVRKFVDELDIGTLEVSIDAALEKGHDLSVAVEMKKLRAFLALVTPALKEAEALGV